MRTRLHVTPFVLWLGDPRAADPTLVGPEAAHLSALAAEIDVPRGFCTADAWLVRILDEV
jgi:hypothetical protein